MAYSRFPNSAAARQNYATKLLAEGDQRSLPRPPKQVKKLRELAPKARRRSS